jgi:hypothetical protein
MDVVEQLINSLGDRNPYADKLQAYEYSVENDCIYQIRILSFNGNDKEDFQKLFDGRSKPLLKSGCPRQFGSPLPSPIF